MSICWHDHACWLTTALSLSHDDACMMLIIGHIDAWYTALSHINAWCPALLMPDAQCWATYWCLMHEPWIHSIEPYEYYKPYKYDTRAQHWVTMILMPMIEPALSHWAKMMPFAQHWAILIMLCCIELSSLHLNWARIMRFWTVHMRKLCNMASMVNGKSWKLGYISASWH